MGSTLMMSEETKQEPDPKLVHWVWDDDPDESLCGIDLTGEPWIDDSIAVDCKKCEEVADLLDELEGEYDG